MQVASLGARCDNTRNHAGEEPKNGMKGPQLHITLSDRIPPSKYFPRQHQNRVTLSTALTPPH